MKPSRYLPTTLTALGLTAGLLFAQVPPAQPKPDSVALPQRVPPETPALEATPAATVPAPAPLPAPVPGSEATPVPAPAVVPPAAPPAPATKTPVMATRTPAVAGKKGEILLNFQGASAHRSAELSQRSGGFRRGAGSPRVRHGERRQPPADFARKKQSIF